MLNLIDLKIIIQNSSAKFKKIFFYTGNFKKTSNNKQRRRNFIDYIDNIDTNVEFLKILNFREQSLPIEGMAKAPQLDS